MEKYEHKEEDVIIRHLGDITEISIFRTVFPSNKPPRQMHELKVIRGPIMYQRIRFDNGKVICFCEEKHADGTSIKCPCEYYA